MADFPKSARIKVKKYSTQTKFSGYLIFRNVFSCEYNDLKYFKQVRISFKIIYYSLTFAGIIFATIEKPNDDSEGNNRGQLLAVKAG